MIQLILLLKSTTIQIRMKLSKRKKEKGKRKKEKGKRKKEKGKREKGKKEKGKRKKEKGKTSIAESPLPFFFKAFVFVVSDEGLLLCRLIDGEYTAHPFYGTRRM